MRAEVTPEWGDPDWRCWGGWGLTSDAIRGREPQRRGRWWWEAGPEVAGGVCQLVGRHGTGGGLWEVMADQLGVRGGQSMLARGGSTVELDVRGREQGGWRWLARRGAS
jgi:hypothetical protein